MRPPEVSIVILTRNGQRFLREVLEQVFSQDMAESFEVIVIDSSSVDRTWEIAQSFPVRAERIPVRAFSHSKTRNWGAQLARGSYVVYLTQDATPGSPHWLRNLLSDFKDERVAGVYSRQVCRQGWSSVEEEMLVPEFYGSGRQVRQMSSRGTVSADEMAGMMFFSNVSAAYRRDLLLENPFDEQLSMAEDQEWCKRMLERGWKAVYEPSSYVTHSNNHSWRALYRRRQSEWLNFALFMPLDWIPGEVLNVKNDLRFLRRAWRWVWADPGRSWFRKISDGVRIPWDRLISVCGTRRGWSLGRQRRMAFHV